MKKFHFRFEDSEADTSEEDREFDSVAIACEEATRDLSFLVSTRLPDGSSRLFSVSVTNESGEVIYNASLQFAATRQSSADR